MILLSGLILVLATAAGSAPFDIRVDATRAVERIRYQYVIHNDKPFDEVYPRKIFEDRIRRQLDEERLLKETFGVEITGAMLANEFERIEVTTRDEDQWATVKNVLGNNRAFIEEIFCRPLVVNRLLRQKFDLDRTIHAEPHQEARRARALFLDGKKVAGSRTVEIAREGAEAASIEEMLGTARAEAEGPRVLSPAEPKEPQGPVPVEPEVARVLTKELREPGDVSTILEHRDRFVIYRLLAIDGTRWKVETKEFPKLPFDPWFARERMKPSQPGR